MRYLFALVYFIIGGYTIAYSQGITVRGKITDEYNTPLLGSKIQFHSLNVHTNEQGEYSINNIPTGKHRIVISHVGYITKDTLIVLHHPTFLNIKLKIAISNLKDVLIKTSVLQKSITNKETVNQKYIQDQFAGSLSKSLEKLPGINAMEIGAGSSKPMIRGLGFNRVVAAENGIKHEGQQWGADHGLEMDALTVENVEILKGVGSIEYGSDAIGGVINIKNESIPEENVLVGEWTTLGKTVNKGLTSSLNLQYRKNHFFYKLKNTISEYADYRVPTDQILYLTRKIPIYNGKLKNTAGKELNWFGQIGYLSDAIKSTLSFSTVYQKSGFFPGSHGIPSLYRVQDDGNDRNIDYPYQRVNHFKVTSHTRWLLDTSEWNFQFSYQNNLRQEWSEFHTHYTGQTRPATNPDLELEFNLNTYDAQIKYSNQFSEKHKTTFGLQGQWQQNTVQGFNFLLPEYNRKNYGFFITHDYEYSEKTKYSIGARFDYSQMDIKRFYDPILYNYLISNNETSTTANRYAERSATVHKEYTNFNIMGGITYQFSNRWGFSLNTGTSFRLPTAIELGANGIHHGSFRHEQGNANLNPEKGFVFDTKLSYTKESLYFSLSPYLYYFDNYIFLNPSGTFSILPHAGQIYQYKQTKAFLSGIEFDFQKTFFEKIKTQVVLEYLYNRQISPDKSKNFPLPFSPPANGYVEIGYSFFEKRKMFHNSEIYMNTKFSLEQNNIAQNEAITAGYTIWGGGIKSTIKLNNFNAKVHLQVTNLLNRKYYNHISFYRALEIPEIGRNIQLMIIIPFNTKTGA
ncbi:TonB-dependent receptor [Flavobacterium sp. '19STA2R22 D10 B1']|uniref:TonB-dependent receptor n=1 Tax=Flavobacterium aerium TaxID=3037261 RepID=UPI00278C59B8|nr:TonB-dependent receptor [Flavobacterium sp. '19STA2R22 D10 B1']